jgi:hypothetical protein
MNTSSPKVILLHLVNQFLLELTHSIFDVDHVMEDLELASPKGQVKSSGQPMKTVSVPEKALFLSPRQVPSSNSTRPSFQQIYDDSNANRKSQSFSFSPSKKAYDGENPDELTEDHVGPSKATLPRNQLSFSIVVSDQSGMKKDILHTSQLEAEKSEETLRTLSYERLKTFQGFDSTATNLATHGSVIVEEFFTPLDQEEKDRLITSFVISATLGHVKPIEKSD